MKKITNRMISFAFLMCMGLFLFSLRVNAANNVTTINASGDTQGATISGTTDDDVVAVLIEILDESNQVVTLETHAVTAGEYSATLSCTLVEGSTYTAYVVNYNGTGEPKKTTFVIPISVTGVALNKTSGTITTEGGTLQLTATVSPTNATNPAVTWSSSNPSVATVDTTGKVTAVANGTATITVTTTDQNKTATATITVAISSGEGSGTGSGEGSGTDNGTGSVTGSGTGSGTGSSSSGSSSSGSTTTPAPTTPAKAEVTTSEETKNTITTTTTAKPATTTEESNTEQTTGVCSEDGADGWTNIKTEINDKLNNALETAEDEEIVVAVEMNGEDTVPADVFETIEGQNITVTFDMGNGIVWAVNGMDVTAGNFTDINFGASTGEGVTSIPAELITNLVEDRFCVELTLEYEGEFGFTAVMSVNVDKNNAGKYANLFYYNPETECMEFICSAPIKEDGTVDLTFTHASDYVIVVGETVMSVADNVSAEDINEATPEETPAETPAETSPVEIDTVEDDAFSPFWIIVIGILILLVSGIVILAVNKKKE